MASRIHGDVYVRFRGRYAETCRRKAVRHCTYGRRFGLSLPKGGEKMPITLTFHLFGLTFTLRIKK